MPLLKPQHSLDLRIGERRLKLLHLPTLKTWNPSPSVLTAASHIPPKSSHAPSTAPAHVHNCKDLAIVLIRLDDPSNTQTVDVSPEAGREAARNALAAQLRDRLAGCLDDVVRALRVGAEGLVVGHEHVARIAGEVDYGVWARREAFQEGLAEG
ncbi:uncharacterized protein N7529_007533 [Penicillium soppii]|uniref:uncharacterized protein n=1 Tax=Penicillium soppii TaxID=69789 RepID=UPI002548186E|nr:uncharacterized protein N7529_007533 [Penicillium soppii]KAJ5860223.1 hypothetical protein N7529_007533 [Penicillium soppii]